MDSSKDEGPGPGARRGARFLEEASARDRFATRILSKDIDFETGKAMMTRGKFRRIVEEAIKKEIFPFLDKAFNSRTFVKYVFTDKVLSVKTLVRQALYQSIDFSKPKVFDFIRETSDDFRIGKNTYRKFLEVCHTESTFNDRFPDAVIDRIYCPVARQMHTLKTKSIEEIDAFFKEEKVLVQGGDVRLIAGSIHDPDKKSFLRDIADVMDI